jgi:tRNA threonylcarbamoyladenosine biosynthesis protein TsaE
MITRKRVSHSEDETLQLGRRIGDSIAAPQLILLKGELGAGKTLITRGLVEGLGCEDSSIVHSPTFTLVNRYETDRGPVYHVDLYRLDTARDQYSIGLEEILTENAVIIVEWSEKLLLRTGQALRLDIQVQPDETRLITIQDTCDDAQ